jgi:CRISPR-associated exonuclease Cas4
MSVSDLEISERYLPLSALQHYAYCPRQFALIHTEQAWEDNQFTAQGLALHERVDSGQAEQRGRFRSERGVQLLSHIFRLVGKMDLLEIETTEDGAEVLFPVEYKRGKPKLQDWDRIQVCAQALCLEEMRGVKIEEGAIWYWEVRRREPVPISSALRETTLETITAAHALLLTRATPQPTLDVNRCKACSLVELCQPKLHRNDRSADYVRAIFDAPSF